jgi:hypothetical protein
MSLNNFLQDLLHAAGIGRAEKRFARDLARTVGFRVAEPSHGTPATPAGLSANTVADAADRERSYKKGHAAGRDWATNRAFVSDINRLALWATTAGSQITGAEVASMIDGSGRPFVAGDVEALRQNDEWYARGLVAGALKF